MKKNKRLKIYRMLGAEIFQQIVFKVEKLKYYCIEKFFPNIDKIYYNKCDKIRDKKLKNAKTEEEKINIIEKFRQDKLKFKKELLKRENRNYHLDLNNPDETIRYLNINKSIHKRGLIGNIVLSSILLFLNMFTSNIFINIFLIYQIISAIINFECINLQNYNLCRLNEERVKKILEKKTIKKQEEFENKMSKGKKIIGNSFRSNIDIPSKNDIINNISSKEEAIELLEYLKKHLKDLEVKKHERKKKL